MTSKRKMWHDCTHRVPLAFFLRRSPQRFLPPPHRKLRLLPPTLYYSSSIEAVIVFLPCWCQIWHHFTTWTCSTSQPLKSRGNPTHILLWLKFGRVCRELFIRCNYSMLICTTKVCKHDDKHQHYFAERSYAVHVSVRKTCTAIIFCCSRLQVMSR